MTPIEKRVFQYLSTKRTISDIAKHFNIPYDRARRICIALFRKGVVFTRTPGTPVKGYRKGQKFYQAYSKSLIKKLGRVRGKHDDQAQLYTILKQENLFDLVR